MSVALRLLVVVLALGMTACGSPDQGSRRGELLLWTSHNNEEVAVFRELIARFETDFAKRRGRPLKVKIGRVAHEGLETKLKSAALSGTTPDICRLDVANVATLAWGQAAVRLDTTKREPFSDRKRLESHFVSAALASNLVPVPTGKGRAEVGLYGIPEQTNCLVLFRNRALFRARATELRAAGLDPDRAPATWKELVAYGRVLADPAKNIAAFGFKNTLWWSLPFLYSGGGDVFHQDPKLVYRPALEDPASLAAYRYWLELAQTKHSGPAGEVTVEGGFWSSERDVHKAFLEGRLAMAMSGPWSVPLFRARVPELAASAIPAGRAGSVSTVGGSNLVILRSCVDREAALDLLEFVGSDEYQLEWSQRLQQIPTTKAALDQALGGGGATLKVFMKQMKTARGRPPLPSYEPVEDTFQAEMELALRGQRTLEEALRRVRTKIEEAVLAPLRDSL